MKAVIAVMFLSGSFLATACGGGGQPAPAADAPAATGNVEVTFKSEPDPPKMGDNTFDVMDMSGGQPVTDADVSVEFFMPAMPEMKMAEMRNTVALKHESGGRYRGAGNVMMAGNWDATVTVKRGGQTIGTQKFPVTAQ
jgi:hypothetical protein